MKTLKITPPEGYEIDKNKSSFEEIIFKPVKKNLPKSWEELGIVNGWYVRSDATIHRAAPQNTNNYQKNLFATEAQAKASIALAQLSQLRDVYRGGWVPDWNDTNEKKYVIGKHENTLKIYFNVYQHYFLAFQSAEIRDEFLKNFKDLIEEASPLLFG